MKQFSQNKFIRYLVKNRLVPLHRINLARHEQKRVGGTLAANLLQREYISEDDLNRAIAATMNIPFIELVPQKLDRDVLNILPAEVLTEYQAVPLAKEGRVLHVALADPTDQHALHDLAIFSRCEIMPSIAMRDSIQFVLDYFLATQGGLTAQNYRLPDYTPPPDLAYEKIVEDTTGATLVYAHLLDASRKQVREIHFEPVGPGLRVRYRTPRGMQERALYPPVFRGICLSRLRTIAGLEPDEIVPVSRSVSMTLGGKKTRLGISFFPARQGVSALVGFTAALGSAALQPGDTHRQPPMQDFSTLLRQGQGLFILSGKKRDDLDILSEQIFRDAVSSRLKAIAIKGGEAPSDAENLEILVSDRTDRNYARAVQQASRQNPDLLLVDYLDGADTLEQVLQVALSGATVLGVSGFGHSLDLLVFLLECGFKGALLASVLRAILVLRAVRLLCPDCRRRVALTEQQEKHYAFLLPTTEGWEGPYQATGCPACEQTGFSATQWLFETVVITPELRDFLMGVKEAENLRLAQDRIVPESIVSQARRMLLEGLIDFAEFEQIVS